MTSTKEENLFNFVATDIEFKEDVFLLYLHDGRVLSIPYDLIPSLSRATKEQRENCELCGMGTSLRWPDIDEDLTVEGLVLGRKIIDWKKVI